MAKNFIKPRKHESGRLITTKTPFGTTSDMVVDDESIISKFSIPQNFIVAKDDDGYYLTKKDRVNSGLADPFRYDMSHREKFNRQLDK